MCVGMKGSSGLYLIVSGCVEICRVVWCAWVVGPLKADGARLRAQLVQKAPAGGGGGDGGGAAAAAAAAATPPLGTSTPPAAS